MNQKTYSIIFSLNDDYKGSLAQLLQIVANYNINLVHIESRGFKFALNYEFLIICDAQSVSDFERLTNCTEIQNRCRYFNVIWDCCLESTWFPRTLPELDRGSSQIMSYGIELDADHPGFTDVNYRQRRKEIIDLIEDYKFGDPIPEITYTDDEIETWNTCFTSLRDLYSTHACREYNNIIPNMFEKCGYKLNSVPQLNDVSKYLNDCTGFRIRPVAGLLSPRAFLAGFAFKIYHATQYMRHGSQPFYTPEPDICHELLGHLPLFADPTFADFVHQIGLASLGASEEFTDKLSTLLWFTVEFGLCKENGELRAFGGGLLSSFNELKYSLSESPEIREFLPEKACLQAYPITNYQPIYYAAESIDDARIKLIKFSETVPRPFTVKFNSTTDTIEIKSKTGLVDQEKIN